jgi:hypothetical protein
MREVTHRVSPGAGIKSAGARLPGTAEIPAQIIAKVALSVGHAAR